MRNCKAHFLANLWPAALWPCYLLPPQLHCSKSVNCKPGRAQGRKSSESCSPVCFCCRNQDILPTPHRNSRDFFSVVVHPPPAASNLPPCRAVSAELLDCFSTNTSESVFQPLERGIWPLWLIFLHFGTLFAFLSLPLDPREKTGHSLSVMR